VELNPNVPFGEFVVDGPELLALACLAVFAACLLTAFLRLTRPNR
jgi:hypothetical protein